MSNEGDQPKSSRSVTNVSVWGQGHYGMSPYVQKEFKTWTIGRDTVERVLRKNNAALCDKRAWETPFASSLSLATAVFGPSSWKSDVFFGVIIAFFIGSLVWLAYAAILAIRSKSTGIDSVMLELEKLQKKVKQDK